MPGVISEDLTEKGRRGLVYMSQIEVCCCCFCLSETGAVGLFPALLRSPLPCVPLPSETPKRASERLSTAPTSEGKHLGTEGETVPDKHTAPTQILLQEGKHPSSHSKRRHVRPQSFLHSHQFREQSQKAYQAWTLGGPQLLLFN